MAPTSREVRAARRAARRENQRQAPGLAVPSSTGGDGLVAVIGEGSGGSGARPGSVPTATAIGGREVGEGSGRRLAGARRLQAAARDMQEKGLDDLKLDGGQNFYTISHNYVPPVVVAVQSRAGGRADTSSLVGQAPPAHVE